MVDSEDKSPGIDDEQSVQSRILARVTEHYLESSQFNGIPLKQLASDLGLPTGEVIDSVRKLVGGGQVSVETGERFINPHIKAFPDAAVEQQMQMLSGTSSPEHTCIYPTGKHLAKVVDKGQNQDRPFTLALALGAEQFKTFFFDPQVLEFYRNDPRYYYWLDDVQGTICVSDDYFESEGMPEKDQVLLKTFGFAYGPEAQRVVVAYAWYLSCLSPEHQQVWNTRMVEGDYQVNPDYLLMTIGEWPERVPILYAFIEEMKTINEMSAAMRRSPFFRTVERPKEFGFLIRPTSREFNDFVHLLDKLMSDNINRDFFQSDVPYETETERKDGKVVVTQKGTIQILDDWIARCFRFDDMGPIEKMIKTLRRVRKMRQKPAHAVNEDVFDPSIFQKQRDLILDAYEAMRMLRLVFANHPQARHVKIHTKIQEGAIWTY